MLTRADVERIIENKLADNNVLTKENLIDMLRKDLTIEVSGRTIIVRFDGILIDKASFDIN